MKRPSPFWAVLAALWGIGAVTNALVGDWSRAIPDAGAAIASLSAYGYHRDAVNATNRLRRWGK